MLPGRALFGLPLSPEVLQLLELEKLSFLAQSAKFLRIDSWLLSMLVLVDSVGVIERRVKGIWNGKRLFIKYNYIFRVSQREYSFPNPRKRD